MPETRQALKAACLKGIKYIRTHGAALENVIHETTKNVIRYGRLFHDTDMALKFVQAIRETMPGYAVNQVEAYIQRHSPIKFSYDPNDKTKIVGVNEAKNEKGELVKAYSPDDVLDKAPVQLDIAKSGRNTRELEPWSFKLYKDRLVGLENQLTKAGEPGGRGILDPKTGKTVFKGQPGWDQAYNTMFNLVHAHRKMIDDIIPMISSGMPAASAEAALKAQITPAPVTKLQAKRKPVPATGPATGTAVKVA